MSQQILTPGYLYWDGFKYVLEPGTFTPAGDLSGDALSQTVIGIETHPVPGPSGVNTVLTWDGYFFWAPASGGGGGGFTPGSDISGNSTSTTTNQYVSSLSYSSDPAGGIITINGTNTSLVWAANNIGPSISQADTTGAGANFSLTAQNTTVINNTAGNFNITGGSNTATQTGDDGGDAGDVNITGGSTRQVAGGGGDINLAGGRNLGVGGGGGATPASLTLPGGYANGANIVFTLATDGDGNVHNLLINDPYSDTWFTISATTKTVIISPEGTANVTATFGKFAFNQGWRRHVTSISSGATYTIDTLPTWDDYVAITTLTASFQINMPATPVTGNTYVIKDTVGAAASFNVTVSGNGNMIDGASTFVMTNNFEAIEVTWTGTQWSIS
jgi:hypothetical protein